jgi:hypothetical protein
MVLHPEDADSKLTATPNAHDQPSEFKFGRALARFWRDGREHYGAWWTARELASRIWRAMVELTPSRRRARYGDIDYDFEQSVNTTRANVGLRQQCVAILTGSAYYATEPWLFRSILEALPIRFEEFTFIDLGSGKGRALLMAAEYPFLRILGLEWMPEFHQLCLDNIQRWRKAHPESPEIEALCMDARDFQFPSEPLVIYLFNPFPEPVFAAVLENIRHSVSTNPRPIYIAYRYPELENLLAASDWLTRVAGTEQWVVYRNRAFVLPTSG